MPLKCRCSRKWAAPEVSNVSFLLPAPINTPTTARGDVPLRYVHTLMPFEITVVSIARSYLSGSGISPGGKSPKFLRIGSLLNYNFF